MNSLRLLDHLLAPPAAAPAAPPAARCACASPAPPLPPRLWSASACPSPSSSAPRPAAGADAAPLSRRRHRFLRPPEASRFRRRWARLWGFDWPARPSAHPPPPTLPACPAPPPPPAPPAASAAAAPALHPASTVVRSPAAAPADAKPPSTSAPAAGAAARPPCRHPGPLTASPCPPQPTDAGPDAPLETLAEEEDAAAEADAPRLAARAQDDNQTLVSTRSSGSDQLSLCETLVVSDHAPEKAHDDEPLPTAPKAASLPATPTARPACILTSAPGSTVAVAAAAAAPGMASEKCSDMTKPSAAMHPQLKLEMCLARVARILVAIAQALVRMVQRIVALSASDGETETPTSKDQAHTPEEKTARLSDDMATSDASTHLLPDPHGDNSALPVRGRRPSAPGSARRAQVKAQVVDSTPKTLVLDLDETLIHSVARSSGRDGVRSSFGLGNALGVPRRMFGSGLATLGLGPSQAPGFSGFGSGTTSVEVVVGGRGVVYTVHKRPGVDAFLAQVAEWYSVVVFTASVREYADPVIDWLDAGRGLFQDRLFRESCIYKNGAYIKDLAAVVRQAPGANGAGLDEDPLRRVCLLDNSPASWRLHPANGIPIEGWTHDPYDTALMDLLPVLDSLRFCDDVRHVLGIRLLATQTETASRPASLVSARRSTADTEKPVTRAQIHSPAIKTR